MGYKHPVCACVELPTRLLGLRGGCPHDPPRPRPGVRAESPRSRVTVMARHVWAVRDLVYLLGEEDGRSMRVRAMISRIGPDHLVHHPGDLRETGEKAWTMCAQRADDTWPLLYSTIVDCADCGAALQRQGPRCCDVTRQGALPRRPVHGNLVGARRIGVSPSCANCETYARSAWRFTPRAAILGLRGRLVLR